MKPRIFISSTFYDLKYIREDLANFVRSYGYEPILFEDGDIGYTPGKTLDSSCYESMRNSDMVILIIGGEYGSAASGKKQDKFTEYMSVTRNEFKTAIDSGIPVFAMIDRNVMTEYRMYEANYDLIEKEKRELNFVSAKNVNVFRFIKEVRGMVIIPIQEFEKAADIKGFVSKQWADMFKNYLSSLRNEKENEKVEVSVNELKILIQKMSIMLDSVGKNVLTKENPEEYTSVINQQEIFAFCNTLISNMRFPDIIEVKSIDDRKNMIFVLLNCLKDLNIDKMVGAGNGLGREILNTFAKNHYNIHSVSIKSGIEKVNFKLLCDMENMNKIVDIVSQDEYFNVLFCGFEDDF